MSFRIKQVAATAGGTSQNATSMKNKMLSSCHEFNDHTIQEKVYRNKIADIKALGLKSRVDKKAECKGLEKLESLEDFNRKGGS